MFYNTSKIRYDILRQFENDQNEPFAHVYKEHISTLLDIVEKSGDEGEGSIFYGYDYKDRTADKLDPEFKNKRQGIALFAMSKSRVLEVGFNCGFSALLMLIANPNLKIVSVDIGYHSYVPQCAKYLKEVFGDRFTLILGDSREILPMYLFNDNNFDGYHIDGDHREPGAETDLCNVINLARPGSVICFDDADFPQLRNIITLYMLQGSVSHIFDPSFRLPSKNQMFLRINKEKL
jgi:hypothetical protein